MELAVHEFPLTFFTTLAPLGAGAFFMLALSFCFADFSKDQLKKIDRLTIIPLLVALVGLIASFFHLANPGHALNIASTVGSTPLANEITAFGIFMIVAAVYWIAALAGGLKNNSARKGFALVAGILGLIAALFIGLAYAIPTIPTWNNFWTPLSIIGFTFFGAFACFTKCSAALCLEEIGTISTRQLRERKCLKYLISVSFPSQII